MSAGLRASLHALRRFPYASQHRNWEAEILEILAKYLILLVSAVGLEPTTPMIHVDDRALLLLGVPRHWAARHIADGPACGAGVHLCLRRQTQGSCACCYRPRLAFGHRQ